MEPTPEEDIKSGVLKRRESGLGTRWKNRFFVVTNKSTILCFKDAKEATSSRRKPKSKLSLINTTVRTTSLNPSCNDAPFPQFCFQIISTETPNGSALLTACANTDAELRDWIEVFKSSTSGRKDLTKATVQIQEDLRKAGQDIPPEDLDFANEEIGSGASGVVKRGIWLKTTEVAVKALKNLPEFTELQEMTAFYKEIETLSKLRHVNIVQMYGFCRKDSYICLVTEFVRGGNMAKYLQDKTLHIDLALQIELLMNICRGMVYLHNQGVIHRDLKPANILVESWEEGKVKVCDFGLSSVQKKSSASSSNPTESGLGSPQYAAPELGSDNHDNKVDVFSFSIILWEIALRESPWPEIKFGSQFAERYKKGERPRIPLTNMWRNLIEKCWDGLAARRPSFVEIYEEIERVRSEHADEIKQQQRSTLRGMSGLSLQSNGSSASLNSSPSMGHRGTVNYSASNSSFGFNDSSSNLLNNMKKVSKAETLMAALFEGKDSVPWDKFSSTFQVAMATNLQNVNKLKFIFDTNGAVQKNIWNSFLSWFSPLATPNAYETEQDDGYEISQIVEICTPVWFHGFLGSQEAQSSLKQRPPNTFLIRFSTTNPGSYALSVSYGASVGHWRIACERKPFSSPVFKIDVREYKSLDDIIKTHGLGKEPLKVKSGENCYLALPFERNDAH